MNGPDSQIPPRVSVVMSVLRPDSTYLREALASVLRQSLSELELIVLEDPPHGIVAEVVAELEDSRICHVCNHQRMTLADSRNATLELARAELVAILDGDDVCEPGRLETQVSRLERDTELAVLGTQIAVMEDDGGLRGYRAYPVDHEAIVRAMRRYNPIAHPSVMLRKQAVLEAGGYRSRDGAACDDYELWSRMATRGFQFANLPDALVRYRLHAGSMKSRLLRATLRDTLWIKRHYWRDQLDLGDRLRMGGERLLSWLPAGLVTKLFSALNVRRRPPSWMTGVEE